MKKLIFTSLLFTVAFSSAFAQRYMTREGYVRFFSSTPMENIEATTNQASSVIDPSNGNLVFQVVMRSFGFEKALMEEHFNENYVESEKFPKATFSGVIQNLSAVNFTKDGKYEVTVVGKLNIHGVDQDRTVQGVITVSGNEVLFETEFEVVPENHGIEIPSIVRDKIASQMDVTVKAKYQAVNR